MPKNLLTLPKLLPLRFSLVLSPLGDVPRCFTSRGSRGLSCCCVKRWNHSSADRRWIFWPKLYLSQSQKSYQQEILDSKIKKLGIQATAVNQLFQEIKSPSRQCAYSQGHRLGNIIFHLLFFLSFIFESCHVFHVAHVC